MEKVEFWLSCPISRWMNHEIKIYAHGIALRIEWGGRTRMVDVDDEVYYTPRQAENSMGVQIGQLGTAHTVNA